MFPIDRSSASGTGFALADQAATLGMSTALAGGLIQKTARFLQEKTLSPLSHRIANLTVLKWAAPIALIAIGYNALRSAGRLMTRSSEDRLADQVMIGAAFCGVFSIACRANPLLRGFAALFGLVLDAVDLTRVGWKWEEGQVSTGDLLLQAGLTLLFGLDREGRAAIMGLKVPRGTCWVGAAFEARRPIFAASRPGPKRPAGRLKRPRQPRWEFNEERVDLPRIHEGVERRIAAKGVQELSLLLVVKGPGKEGRPQFLFQVRLMGSAVGELRLRINEDGKYETTVLRLNSNERTPSLEGWEKITSPEIGDILDRWVALQNRLGSDGRPPRIGGGSGTPPIKRPPGMIPIFGSSGRPPLAKRAILTFFDGSKRIIHPRELLILGSSRRANLFLEGDPFAAGIIYEDGWTISPFESPVRINDRIILEPHELNQGDRIMIGEKPISFEIEENVPFVEGEKDPQSLGRRSYAVKGVIDIPTAPPRKTPPADGGAPDVDDRSETPAFGIPIKETLRKPD